MAKQLKFWNGRGHGKYIRYEMYVAAYSQKQAAEIINKACDCCNVSVNEIRVYYSNCWGNPMKGIVPEQPCVYVSKGFSDNVKKVL